MLTWTSVVLVIEFILPPPDIVLLSLTTVVLRQLATSIQSNMNLKYLLSLSLVLLLTNWVNSVMSILVMGSEKYPLASRSGKSNFSFSFILSSLLSSTIHLCPFALFFFPGPSTFPTDTSFACLFFSFSLSLSSLPCPPCQWSLTN